MKNQSPRQILLARHQGAQPQLDAVRARVLESLAPTRTAPVPWWQVGWQEVFCSARHAWGGLAALGLLAIGLNITLPGPDRNQPAPPGPSTAVAVAEGWRARAELLADLAGQPSVNGDEPHPTGTTTPADPPQRPAPVAPGGQRSALERSTEAVA